MIASGDASGHERGARPSQVELLRRYGLRLDKRLGQHFLVDARIVERIADAVGALSPERVVELACGAGALTYALLDRGWPVTALELDARMIDLVRAETRGHDLRIEHADLASTDFTALLGDARVVFAGNLPYQVTSPILFGLLPALRNPHAAGAILMVQVEVARRMTALPGGRDYGVLSVLLQAELGVERVVRVKPGCFLPPPEVESAVVRLVRRDEPVELAEDGRTLVKDLFGQRRKQIGGLLRRRLDVDDARVGQLLDRTGIEPRRRPETLSVDDFVRLRDVIRSEDLA